MKILHTVELYYPSVGGIQEVVRQVSERLVKVGHSVTVATTKLSNRKSKVINGVNIEEFEISGNLVRGINGEVKEYQNYLINSNFDIITNFAAQQWTVDCTFSIIDKIKVKKVFVPTGFSGFYFPEYKNYFSRMKEYMKKYDMNVFLSDNYRDINFARKNNISNIVLIPNGASEDEFLVNNNIDIRKKFNISKDDFLILHVGSHTGFKGHSEAIKIFNKAKIKNSVFLIIGNSIKGGCENSCRFKELASNLKHRLLRSNKKIIISSLPRNETVAAYKQADLFLFPSNIECSPIVLFECMAAETPFLATGVGNASEIIGWSNSGKLLPTIKNKNGYCVAKINESAKLLEELYSNEEERQDMAETAFKAWKKRFTWEKIALEYEKLYNNLLK